MAGVIETLFIDTAEEFLDALSAQRSIFGDSYYPSEMLFRGHADHRWPLLPYSLRPITYVDPNTWLLGVRGTNSLQIQAEARALRDFFVIADRCGLPLPEDSQRLRHILNELCVSNHSNSSSLTSALTWPPDELLALLALAQHHGLPTRLLDWSRKAYIAAYFAASKASTWLFGPETKDRNGATHLCVWALTSSVFEVADILQPELAGPSEIMLVTTPAAGNPNLHGQGGLFLVNRPREVDPDGLVDTRAWDILLSESFTYMSGSPLLYQICLPVEEAPRVIRLLALDGIEAATVFPGFDGVVTTLNERRYWESGEDFQKRMRDSTMLVK